MRIVITGALGHIGSRLIRDLPWAFPDMEIVMIDDFSTQRYASLFNLSSSGRYRFFEADVLRADLESIFTGAHGVIHLAAITNAMDSFEIQEQVEQVNFVGAQKVAQACVATDSAMVFLSTTSVYGTQKKVVDEGCAVTELKPQSPYARSKLKAEQYLQGMGETDGLRFVVCRFGTIYGTSIGMRFHTAINKFCFQAVTGQPITVWRTALDQKRPYLDLGDAVEAVKFVLRRNLFDRKVYNVLTVNTSVRHIVDLIRSQIPNASIKYVDTPIMNQLSYVVKNERFARLGFEFKGSIEQAITETIQLFRGLRHG